MEEKVLISYLNKEIKISYFDMPNFMVKQYQNFTQAKMQKFNLLLEKHNRKVEMTPANKAVEEYVQQYLLKEQIW